MSPTVLKEWNCAGIECHSLTAPLLRDKAFQPCKDFIVELLSRKGRPHPPVQTRKILLTVSLHTHVPTIQNFSSTYTQMKNKLTGFGPEKRQRRQTKMLHRQSKRNIRAEDTNETISGPKQHFERKQALKSPLPGPQKWGHFSAEKPVTWEGASPVRDPDVFFATSTWCSVKIFDASPSHTRALQWSNLFKVIIKSALIDGFLLPCLQKCLQHRLIYKANICDFLCSF